MTEVMNFFADLLSRAEFWSLSTLGVSLSSIGALLWARRGQIALTASNVLQKGLKDEISAMAKTESDMKSTIMSQAKQIEDLSALVKLLNDNLYVLAQGANIGVENKQLIAKNYLESNETAPLVQAAKEVVETGIEKLTDKVEALEEQSSLDDLLKKV
jgi:gas vesicle protein